MRRIDNKKGALRDIMVKSDSSGLERACFCIGPQKGETKCPCMKRIESEMHNVFNNKCKKELEERLKPYQGNSTIG